MRPPHGNVARMEDDKDKEGSILRFRHRKSSDLASPEDLAKFERGAEPEDYRHRMAMNVLGFATIAGLIFAGLWIVNSIADLRKNQDCALQGRRNCLSIEVNRDAR